MELLKRYQLSVLIGIMAVLLFSVAIFTDGTCDSGDSVTHYLYARYAFIHPANFLDHWAKPVFVLLASPFAQFGFTGIKIFNVIVSLCTAIFVFRIAVKLGMKNAILAPVFLFAFPLYTICIFSGLTEPLFGLMLTLSVWFILSERLSAGLILISFLPFCRSEGLIIIFLAAIYLFVKKKKFQTPIGWDKFFLLFTGHVFYSLVGAIHHKDLLWVFSKIPYKGEVLYGHGGWTHFFYQSPSIFGIPLLVILFLSGINILMNLRSESKTELFPLKYILIYGSFLAVFAAHVVFWKFGMFSSFGLKRVIVAVLPMAALIGLIGFNWIREKLMGVSAAAKNSVCGLILSYVILFPFLPNPAAFNFNRDFSLKDDQKCILQASDWIRNFYGTKRIYTEHYYVAMAMNIDPFDPQAFSNIGAIRDGDGRSALIIWDDWYGGGRIQEDKLKSSYKELTRIQEGDSKVIVFEKLEGERPLE